MKFTECFYESSWFQHLFFPGEKATAGVAGTLPSMLSEAHSSLQVSPTGPTHPGVGRGRGDDRLHPNLYQIITVKDHAPFATLFNPSCPKHRLCSSY